MTHWPEFLSRLHGGSTLQNGSKSGENKIEILVYNTLANHYLTIPTKYRGSSFESGLLGPVNLELRTYKHLP